MIKQLIINSTIKMIWQLVNHIFYIGFQKMAFKVKSNWFWTKECIAVHRVSFQSNFTLLNCSGYRISSFLNAFKKFPYLSLFCMQCCLKIRNLGTILLHINSWIWTNLCHKKLSSINFVPRFSQQKYSPSIQCTNISLDYCVCLCSAHNRKSYGNATSHLRGSTVPA